MQNDNIHPGHTKSWEAGTLVVSFPVLLPPTLVGVVQSRKRDWKEQILFSFCGDKN